jgi:uroporphyrinogen-III synthase
VTRSSPGAEGTAERLRALGYEAVVQPLLTVRFLPGEVIDLKKVAAIAFTSANGVTGFIRRSLDRGHTVYAVGSATAAAAKAAGFAKVLSADGDVEALAAGIASRRRELSGVLLHATATERAGDLEGALSTYGVEVKTLAVYETVAASIPDDIVARMPALYAVTVHSAKAAQALAGVLAAHPARRLRACCLSRAVAKPLMRAPLAKLSAAAKPTEEALIDLFRW